MIITKGETVYEYVPSGNIMLSAFIDIYSINHHPTLVI